jgi:hypothetical protein
MKQLSVSTVAAGGILYALTALYGEDAPRPVTTHRRFNSVETVPIDAGPTTGENIYRNPPSPICATVPSSAANVNTDCEGDAPHNETSIAINPSNPLNIIASANDYQLRLSSGGQTFFAVYSRAHVTFDGGLSWTTYPVPFNGYNATGDPAVAFDADGRAYLATLGETWSQGLGAGTSVNILVSTSTDGGKTWSAPNAVTKAPGALALNARGQVNDKEYIAAWGHGNAIVTWTRFDFGPVGSYINSPIYAAVTHDGGRTWTNGTEISGSASFCIGAQGGTACDQCQGSVPSVAADGSIYVAFLNTASLSTGRDQYLVVRVDPNTGARIGGPYRVADVVDGYNDYPINQDYRQTYQDSQFRTWAAGNIAADPRNPGHLVVAWSDMRNSALPAPSDPYQAITNSDIVISQSFDGGLSWSAPRVIAAPGDQFMPWAAYDLTGRLRIGYFDRSYDPANHRYGYTLATELTPGSLIFTRLQLTTQLSDPTRGNRWFAGITVNAAFPNPTSFLGDYSGIAVNGSAVAALWTDMREQSCFGLRCGAGQHAYFGSR